MWSSPEGSKVAAASGKKKKKKKKQKGEHIRQKLCWKRNDSFSGGGGVGRGVGGGGEGLGVKCQNKDFLIWRFSKTRIPP